MTVRCARMGVSYFIAFEAIPVACVEMMLSAPCLI